MPFSDEELATYKEQSEKVDYLAERFTAPDGWHLRERKRGRAVYQHNSLPIILEVFVTGSYPLQPESLARAQVKTFGSITVGENRYGSDASEPFWWAIRWMENNPHPVELVEGSRVAWHEDKNPARHASKERYADIGVIRETS